MTGLLIMGIIGLVFSIGVLATEYDARKAGREWYSSIKNGLHFTKNDMLIYQNASEVKKYRVCLKKNVYITFYQQGDDWRIEYGYTENRPFYSFTYRQRKQIITDSEYKKHRLIGLLGYISLPKKKMHDILIILQNKAIDIISEIIHAEPKQPYISEQQKTPATNPVLQLRNKLFAWRVKPAFVRIKLHNGTIYKRKESNKHIHCFCQRDDTMLYSIIKEKETGEVVAFDIDENVLKDIQDVKEYAHEQQLIWQEIETLLREHEAKKEQLKEQLSTKKGTVTTDVWVEFEPLIEQTVVQLLENKHVLNEEQRWYLEETLPKRLEEIRSLHQEQAINEEQIKKAIKNIVRKLNAFEKEIHHHKERKAERVVLLSEID